MNPLEQLKDIHLPPAVNNWPPAYGWWLLAIVLIILLVVAAKFFFNRYKMRQPQREAIKQMRLISHQQSDWPMQLNQLLKRLVISYYPQQETAGLYLDDWCEFLTKQLPTNKQKSFRENIQSIQHFLYQRKATEPDFVESITQAMIWVKHATPAKLIKTEPKVIANV